MNFKKYMIVVSALMGWAFSLTAVNAADTKL